MKQRYKLVAPDAGLLVAVIALVIIGVLMVFDASYARQGDASGDIWYTVRKQGMWLCVGLPAMYFASITSFAFLRKWHKPFVYLSFAMLVAVLIPGIGKEIGGGHSYFRFGDVGMQPSEVSKLAVALFLASVLSVPRVFAKRAARTWVIPFWISLAIIGLVVQQNDFGTAVLLTGICLAVFFGAGAKKRYIAGAALGMVGLAMLMMVVKPHAQVRLKAFQDPWAYPFNEGYQTIHSLIAFGTGGLFGQGLCEGREKFYLPAAHTDYIFSTCGEELGLLGSLAVLGLFAFVVYRGLDIARRCKSAYGNLLALGLTTMIGFQAVINIAVVTNSIPATGIPLPFISYGGSALVTMMIAAGLLLSISRQVNVELEERESHEGSSYRRRDRRPYLSGNRRRPGTSGGRGGRRTSVRR